MPLLVKVLTSPALVMLMALALVEGSTLQMTLTLLAITHTKEAASVFAQHCLAIASDKVLGAQTQLEAYYSKASTLCWTRAPRR